MSENSCISGESCIYKKMYEGSQKSLTDMSSRQSSSLTRLGRFRSGIVTVIRRAFPNEAKMAESSMGRRLIDTDDEILLSFIERLTTDSGRRDEKLALKAIGSILSNNGFPIDLNKHPVEWLNTITEHLQVLNSNSPSLSDLFGLSENTVIKIEGDISKGDTTTTARDNVASSLQENRGDSASDADMNDLASLLWDANSSENGNSESWSPSPVAPKKLRAKSDSLGSSFEDVVTVSTSDISVIVPTSDSSLTTPSDGRPQLFPAGVGGKSRKSRKPRIVAEPASPFGEVYSESLDDDLVQALIAASSIPRPVFTRDLVSITGSAELVESWEDSCRSDPNKYPIRFIAPKQRHRLRGSLVIPDVSTRSTTKPSDWWFKCMDAYRSARLYELAVLLHSVGDEIVAFNFGEHCASLRLNSDRGLVGVLVMLDSRVDVSDPAYAVLEKELSIMLSERLTLVSVLTYSGESADLDLLCNVVSDLAITNSWNVSVPVIASKCWEYAEDRGSNSRIILGG